MKFIDFSGPMRTNCDIISNTFQTNEKTLQKWLDHELEVMVNVHEVRFEYEKQSQVYVILFLHYFAIPYDCLYLIDRVECFYWVSRAVLAEELAMLKREDELVAKCLTSPGGKNGSVRYQIFKVVMTLMTVVMFVYF